MLTKEYEGKSEKDAIKSAVSDLCIPKDKLVIETLQKKKSGFLGKGRTAIISVSYNEEDLNTLLSEKESDEKFDENSIEEYEEGTLNFLIGLFNGMDFDVDIEVHNDRTEKVFINLKSPESALIIGKRGKTLEAIQMLTNIVVGNSCSKNFKSVIDIENYREKRESILIDLAHKVANEVKRTGKSKSFEPMNPFERRLIHLALQDEENIKTKSEGDGIYRKVRVLPGK